MSIVREKIVFEAGQGTVETNKVIFQIGQWTLLCEKVRFLNEKIIDRQLLTIPINRRKRVSWLQCKSIMADTTGEVNITDLMLQDGAKLSGYMVNTKEMLRKLREYDLPTESKFFNVVIRGRKTVIIPNRGETIKVSPYAPVVTAPINFTLWAIQALAAGIQFSHFYRTRIFNYLNTLDAEDKLEFLATAWQVKHNDAVKTKITDYNGLFFEIAAGDGHFNIDLIPEEFTERPQPSARILVDIQEWEKDKGTLKL